MKSFLPPYWAHFNFSHSEIEQKVSEREGSYKNLLPEALYTSMDDLVNIFHHPLMQGSFCDLGCGTGLAPLLYADLFHERQSFGLEFEIDRLKVGLDFQASHKIENAKLYHADLLSSEIPSADIYFLYFPTGPVLDRILDALYISQRNFKLVVIESHGDLIPRIKLENWLTLKAEIPLIKPRHYHYAQIYERNSAARFDELWPFTVSFKHQYLMISENGEDSIAESFGLEWIGDDKFNLLIPPRTVHKTSIKSLFDPKSAELTLALKLRREDSVKIQTATRNVEGYIRKIIIHPSFRLEISSGEQVEWKNILTITQGSHLCYVFSS